MLAITILPIDRFWLNHMVGPWNDPKGDILIVLGGDSLGDMLGAASYLRSVYATRVWHEGGFRQVVISGGTANGGLRVSEQMRDFLVCQGVPANAIVLESQSQDTHQNAVFTARLLAAVPGKKVLLTSDYHMFRAFRAFRKTGLAVEPRPFPDAYKRINRWNLRWPVFLDLCLEGSKICYYRLQGWI